MANICYNVIKATGEKIYLDDFKKQAFARGLDHIGTTRNASTFAYMTKYSVDDETVSKLAKNTPNIEIEFYGQNLSDAELICAKYARGQIVSKEVITSSVEMDQIISKDSILKHIFGEKNPTQELER